MAEPNPNGANGSTSDPREQTCWDFYLDSIRNGTPNAHASALKAGYSKDHSSNITLQGWFKEREAKLRRRGLLSKSEKIFEKTLDYNPEQEDGKIDTALLRIQTDVSKHITSTLGKDEGYSTRSELTGKDGEPITIVPADYSTFPVVKPNEDLPSA